MGDRRKFAPPWSKSFSLQTNIVLASNNTLGFGEELAIAKTCKPHGMKEIEREICNSF